MNFAEQLARIDALGRRRFLRRLESPQGPRVILDGRELIGFSSNDYLGFANHPALVEAATRALETRGHGAGAARLLVGNFDLAAELEAALADYLGVEDVLLLGSGYLANLAVLPSLAVAGERIFSDRLNHASIIDGCRLSRAAVTIYPHNQPPEILGQGDWVVTESVFSMDGDGPDLADLLQRCRAAGARLIVDEAHALGCYGDRGRGLGLGAFARIGTLGKAFGSYGAFVAGARDLVELLRNTARSFIFSTGLPAPVLAASRTAIRLAAGSEGDAARRRLRQRCQQLASGLRELGLPADPSTAIFPVVIGGEADAVATAARLEEVGCLVQAVRPPTVPPGTSRLRIVVTAGHSEDDIARLLDGLTQLGSISR